MISAKNDLRCSFEAAVYAGNDSYALAGRNLLGSIKISYRLEMAEASMASAILFANQMRCSSGL